MHNWFSLSASGKSFFSLADQRDYSSYCIHIYHIYFVAICCFFHCDLFNEFNLSHLLCMCAITADWIASPRVLIMSACVCVRWIWMAFSLSVCCAATLEHLMASSRFSANLNRIELVSKAKRCIKTITESNSKKPERNANFDMMNALYPCRFLSLSILSILALYISAHLCMCAKLHQDYSTTKTLVCVAKNRRKYGQKDMVISTFLMMLNCIANFWPKGIYSLQDYENPCEKRNSSTHCQYMCVCVSVSRLCCAAVLAFAKVLVWAAAHSSTAYATAWARV